MTRFLERIATGIAVAGLVWIIASWVNVVAHNTSDYVYATWNLFTILF